VDNLIKLKKLQVVNGALKKIDERFFFLKFFLKSFFWVRKGGWGTSILFQRRFFLRNWDR